MLLNVPMSIATICKDEADNVDHALTCATCSKSFHFTRHNLTASGMVRVLNMYGLYATTNLKAHFPKVLSRNVEGPDVLVILPSGGMFVLDITVVHVSHDVSRASAVKQRDTYKRNKYSDWNSTIDGSRVSFHPIVVTSVGTIHIDSIKTLRAICSKTPTHGLFRSLCETIAGTVLKTTFNHVAKQDHNQLIWNASVASHSCSTCEICKIDCSTCAACSARKSKATESLTKSTKQNTQTANKN